MDQTLITLLSGGHVLLVGVPGPGQEPAGRDAGHRARPGHQARPVHPRPDAGRHPRQRGAGRRPDGRRSFRFVPGPVFCQLLMADEINRASPRTQSALLQAMQEQRVAVGGVEHPLPRPFHVLATQNPIEQEGTYPLPEAQLDRFLLEIDVSYPDLRRRAHHAAGHHRRGRGEAGAGADRRGADRRPGADPPRAGGRERGRGHPAPGARRPAGDQRATRSCAAMSPGVPARAPRRR